MSRQKHCKFIVKLFYIKWNVKYRKRGQNHNRTPKTCKNNHFFNNTNIIITLYFSKMFTNAMKHGLE